MSFVQENSLWGSGEAVGIRVPGLVLPAWDRRGKDGPGGGGRSRKGSVPTSGTPTLRHLGSCPAPEPGPASGKLKGEGRRKSCRRDRKNRSLGMLLQPAPTQVSHLYLRGWVEQRVWAPKRLGSLQV